ncbi:hypothetical protein [Cupriavidus sp. AU9028]|uniref:hypothetical protein n=1 Tax=Cupriavidus sp. AU9028 TaxID=2871157 RepID=UPI001C965CB1|nr:hypothetical protein [Cupriavidus sp. AU9028]MBY4899056.1 hypothetical protein [Cupriavidus sp. AU9028]
MQLRLPIGSSGDLTVVSTAANDLALRCGFGEIATERLVQAAQRCAEGMLQHAGGGTIYLRALQEEVTGAAPPQVELLAVDAPPCAGAPAGDTRGAADNRLARFAGVATALDCHVDESGMALRMALSPADRPGAVTLPPVAIGVVWASAEQGHGGLNVHSTARLSTLVLGMGRAAESARRVAALQGFAAQLQQIDRMQGALPQADDTALAAIQLDPGAAQLKIAGAGSIDVWLASASDGEQSLPAADERRVQPVLRTLPSSSSSLQEAQPRPLARAQAPWPAGTTLLAHGGPAFAPEQWQAWLASRPGLVERHPAIVAAVLHRDRRVLHAGGSVVVCRRSEESRPAAPPEWLLGSTAGDAAPVAAAHEESA